MRFGAASLAQTLSRWRRLPPSPSAPATSTQAAPPFSHGSAWAVRLLKVAGATAVALPAGAAGALVVSGRGADADALEMLGSLPRTLRVLWWSVWAAFSYKRLAASFAASSISEEDYRGSLEELHARAARRLFRVCQANGGVYVKAGQLAVSMQAVPPTYRHELEGLQDSCLPRSFAAVNRVLLEELGAPAAGLFASFDPVAAAAASLAQVHRATLANGAAVAVKVQYSGLQAAVAADVATLTALAALAAWVFPSSDWRFVFAELRQKLASEMDFRVEAANAARTAANFAGRRDVAVPALVAHMCTKKVIVMEWVDGVKVTDVEGLRRLGLSPRRVALALLDATAEMMCVAGFVHGDLHPGNIFVRAQPSRRPPLLSLLLPWRPSPSPQLVLIDHGAYYELPPEMRLLYCQLWCAFVLNDAATAQDVATRLGGERAGRALPEVLRPRDWARMGAEERRRVQRRTGVAGQADLFRLVNEAPRALLDCLRAAAVVRHTATRLGATVADRLRVNAAQALRGLQVEAPAEGAGGRRRRRRRVVYVGAMRSRWRRWNLWARIAAMRIAAWVALAVGGGRDDAAVPLVE